MKNFLLKNFIFDRVRFSAQVFVVGVILSITFFLFSIDSFKTYHSEVSILVNTKSQLALSQQNKLVSTIVEFPTTLSFYDRLLKLNPDVRDVTAGMSSDERKNTWNNMISVTRLNNDSAVFKIAITAKRESDAQQLVNKSSHTLFNTVGFYYDIKKDVDLRIIDGPITTTQFSSWQWFLLGSILLGFALAAFLSFVPNIIGWIVSKKEVEGDNELAKKNFFSYFERKVEIPEEEELESLNHLYESEVPEETFTFENYLESEKELEKQSADAQAYEEKFQEVKKITKQLEPSKYPNFPEMPVRAASHASAPDNLPIADDSFFAPRVDVTVKEIPEVQAVVVEQPEVETLDENREPTPEELKKRLNELLRG